MLKLVGVVWAVSGIIFAATPPKASRRHLAMWQVVGESGGCSERNRSSAEWTEEARNFAAVSPAAELD